MSKLSYRETAYILRSMPELATHYDVDSGKYLLVFGTDKNTWRYNHITEDWEETNLSVTDSKCLDEMLIEFIDASLDMEYRLSDLED